MRSLHDVLRVLLAVLSPSHLSDERVESILPWFNISFLPVPRFKHNASRLSVFILFWLKDVIGDVPPLCSLTGSQRGHDAGLLPLPNHPGFSRLSPREGV